MSFSLGKNSKCKDSEQRQVHHKGPLQRLPWAAEGGVTGICIVYEAYIYISLIFKKLDSFVS